MNRINEEEALFIHCCQKEEIVLFNEEKIFITWFYLLRKMIERCEEVKWTRGVHEVVSDVKLLHCYVKIGKADCVFLRNGKHL